MDIVLGKDVKRLARQAVWMAILAFMLVVPVTWERVRANLFDGQAIATDNFSRLAGWRRNLPKRLPAQADGLEQRLAARGIAPGASLYLRIFKQERELEVWMRRGERFQHFATYPICRFSGRLGPKLRTGDRQSPEGFYTIEPGQLSSSVRHRQAFNIGFPNPLDRALKRTGSYLMIHGGCKSVGCYAMTDEIMSDLWQLAGAAFDAGQPRFHLHVFPFRMNEANLRRHERDPWAAFWRDLEPAHALFEETGVPPRVQACNSRYVVSPGITGSERIDRVCPNLQTASSEPVRPATARGTN